MFAKIANITSYKKKSTNYMIKLHDSNYLASNLGEKHMFGCSLSSPLQDFG